MSALDDYFFHQLENQEKLNADLKERLEKLVNENIDLRDRLEKIILEKGLKNLERWYSLYIIHIVNENK